MDALNDVTQERPRARRSGKLFDGRVDCYILDDGRKVIAQRGILRCLRGDGREKGDLGTYLARLPERFGHLASDAGVEFALPAGGVALGRPASFFVAVLKAYAEGHTKGELHPAQEPMAKRAMGILCAFAEKGIDAWIDEACGVMPTVPGVEIVGLVESLQTAVHIERQRRTGVEAACFTITQRLTSLEGYIGRMKQLGHLGPEPQLDLFGGAKSANARAAKHIGDVERALRRKLTRRERMEIVLSMMGVEI